MVRCISDEGVSGMARNGLLVGHWDVNLSGEPALLPRRVRHAQHSGGLNPTQLGTTPQAHGVSCAHRFVCHGPAGCFRQRCGHRRRHLRRRCSSTPSQLHIIPAAIDICAIRRDQDGQTRSRCVQWCSTRASGVRDALTRLLCAQVLSWSKMGPLSRVT